MNICRDKRRMQLPYLSAPRPAPRPNVLRPGPGSNHAVLVVGKHGYETTRRLRVHKAENSESLCICTIQYCRQWAGNVHHLT